MSNLNTTTTINPVINYEWINSDTPHGINSVIWANLANLSNEGQQISLSNGNGYGGGNVNMVHNGIGNHFGSNSVGNGVNGGGNCGVNLNQAKIISITNNGYQVQSPVAAIHALQHLSHHQQQQHQHQQHQQHQHLQILQQQQQQQSHHQPTQPNEHQLHKSPSSSNSSSPHPYHQSVPSLVDLKALKVPSNGIDLSDPVGRECANCATTATSLYRQATTGHFLCNSCFSKHQIQIQTPSLQTPAIVHHTTSRRTAVSIYFNNNNF